MHKYLCRTALVVGLIAMTSVARAESPSTSAIDPTPVASNGVIAGTYPAGETETVAGAYLVSAEGARSIVRRDLDIEFEGFTYSDLTLNIEVAYDFRRHGYAERNYISDPTEWSNLFHWKGPPDRWRVHFPVAPSEDQEAACGPEAAWASPEMEIIAASSLIQLANHFKGTQALNRPQPKVREAEGTSLDLKDIKGQESAKCALEVSARYAKQRHQFNKPIGAFGLVASKLAEMAIGIFVGESMGYRTTGLIDDRFAAGAGGDAARSDRDVMASSQGKATAAPAPRRTVHLESVFMETSSNSSDPGGPNPARRKWPSRSGSGCLRPATGACWRRWWIPARPRRSTRW